MLLGLGAWDLGLGVQSCGFRFGCPGFRVVRGSGIWEFGVLRAEKVEVLFVQAYKTDSPGPRITTNWLHESCMQTPA